MAIDGRTDSEGGKVVFLCGEQASWGGDYTWGGMWCRAQSVVEETVPSREFVFAKMLSHSPIIAFSVQIAPCWSVSE